MSSGVNSCQSGPSAASPSPPRGRTTPATMAARALQIEGRGQHNLPRAKGRPSLRRLAHGVDPDVEGFPEEAHGPAGQRTATHLVDLPLEGVRLAREIGGIVDRNV